LILAFETEELRNTCQNEEVAIARYGEERAVRIISRIADLRAAKNLSELVDWCSAIRAPYDGNDTYILQFRDGSAITLLPNHRKLAKKTDRGAELTSTWRVKIISIDHESEG
jgi:hypothetical protein